MNMANEMLPSIKSDLLHINKSDINKIWHRILNISKKI